MKIKSILPAYLALLLGTIVMVLSTPIWAMPGTPVAVSPQDQASVTETPIEFVWAQASTATSYDFYVFDRTLGDTIERVNYLSAAEICDAASLCRYTLTASVSEGFNHVWRVRARNGAGVSAWSFSAFDLQLVAPPAQPTPLAPASNAELMANEPVTFEWSRVTAASHYELLVYDRQVGANVAQVNNLTAASLCTTTICTYTPSIELSTGSNHVWRIRSHNENGSSTWSYTAFDYLAPSPAAPTVLTPASNEVLDNTQSITFQWSPEALATHYDLRVYDRQLGINIWVENNLSADDLCTATACSYTPALTLSTGPNHVWRIRARNGSGLSNWTYTAFNYLQSAPETPAVVAPASAQAYPQDSAITYSWIEEADASHYELTLYDRALAATVHSETNLMAETVCSASGICSVTPDAPLSTANNHVWRIRANGLGGSSSWSYTSFHVVADAPVTPVVVYPSANETVLSVDPIEYRWRATDNATHYEFDLTDADAGAVVAQAQNLNANEICDDQSLCRFTPNYTLAEATGNVWRVKAKNATGESNWTSTSFSTLSERQTPNLTKYELVFSDEFSGSVLDADKWRTTHLWGPYLATNNEEQIYIDVLDWHEGFSVNPIEVQDGNLTIRAYDNRDHSIPGPVQPEESNPIWNAYPEYQYRPEYNAEEVNFFSGIISSYDSFHFTSGYIEARAKIPSGQGLWSAFWLLSAFYVEDIPEIDIMESLGQFPDKIYHTYHYFDTSDGWQQYSTPTLESTSADYSADYHVYAASWDHEYIIWYIDGIEKHRISTQEYPIATQSMYVLANLAVGGNWPGSPDNSTTFPAEFVLDYIRVYQKESPVTITPSVLQSEFELVFADEFNGSSLDSNKWNTAYLWGPYQQINNEQQVYPDVHGMHQNYPVNPFSVDNGILTINAEPIAESDLPVLPDENDSVWNDYPSYRYNSDYGSSWVPSYSSGVITSYDAFKFVTGYVEINARLPAGNGAWPALWLLNGYYVGNLPEIDIVELDGALPDAAHQTYHYSDTNGNVISSPVVIDGGLGPEGYSADFHTYGLHWSPGRIDWYIDGVKTRTLESDNVSDQLMYIIANFAVGGNFVGDVDPTDYPATMDIDYIRVYRLNSE